MSARFLCPCGAGNPGGKAEIHELMIGRVKLHLVKTVTVAVETNQLRRESIGLTAPLNRFSRPGFFAKLRKTSSKAVSVSNRQRRLQCGIGLIKVHAFKGRRLIGDDMRREISVWVSMRHNRSYRSDALSRTGILRRCSETLLFAKQLFDRVFKVIGHVLRSLVEIALSRLLIEKPTGRRHNNDEDQDNDVAHVTAPAGSIFFAGWRLAGKRDLLKSNPCGGATWLRRDIENRV